MTGKVITGHLSANAEKMQIAIELREAGWSLNKIGQTLDVSPTTVRRWIDPEYAERARIESRERKLKYYGGNCINCGKRTSYSGRGIEGAKRCLACAVEFAHQNKKWTREGVIHAIQDWNRVYGKPPSSVDWNAPLARKKGFVRDPKYPPATACYGPEAPFPNWADAIEAAGFPRPRALFHGKQGERIWTEEKVIEALRAHSVNGVAPLSTDWERRGEGRPTNSWVSRLFGNWTSACRAAGLQPQREVRWRGPPRKADVATKDITAARKELALRLTADDVLRRYIAKNLWRDWGFGSERNLRRWLASQGIEDHPGAAFRSNRQMTNEELQEARSLV